MELKCPTCHFKNSSDRNSDKNIRKAGSYHRSSDRKRVQRYHCTRCGTHFSTSTLHDCYRQKKRQFNRKVARLLVAGVSLRESARVLDLNRKTIARKLRFMAHRAREDFRKLNAAQPLATAIQFDDLETFEHSKCKPVSITLAVESSTRRILAFAVASMPAKGRLVSKSLKKYGKRKDDRPAGRNKLLTDLQKLIVPGAEIKTDDNPHYPADVKRHFPNSCHIRIRGGRSANTGQGELKKVAFDPIFSLNHTAAMARYRLSRLIRKTWCTSKTLRGIEDHFALLASFHNRRLAS